jgi:hypothetical protein
VAISVRFDEPPEHQETESPHVTLLADGIATRGLVQLQSHSMIKTDPGVLRPTAPPLPNTAVGFVRIGTPAAIMGASWHCQ